MLKREKAQAMNLHVKKLECWPVPVLFYANDLVLFSRKQIYLKWTIKASASCYKNEFLEISYDLK